MKDETKWVGSLAGVAVVLAVIVAYAHYTAAKALQADTSGLAAAQQAIAGGAANYALRALKSSAGQKISSVALKGAEVVGSPVQTVVHGDWTGAAGDAVTGGAVSLGKTVAGWL